MIIYFAAPHKMNFLRDSEEQHNQASYYRIFRSYNDIP